MTQLYKDQLLKWGTDFLVSNGLLITQEPEVVVATPWSNILRFTTVPGDFYLKRTPSPLFLSNEPKVIQLLFAKFHAPVPAVISINEDLHCFLMKDNGKSLRGNLKTEFKPELLYEAIKQYAEIQRATENNLELFLKLGVPDWRLHKLPTLYNQLVNESNFLKSEGLTELELKKLNDLSSKFLEHCQSLSAYNIPETIGYHDFHDNNILIDSETQKMTFIDWGETTITHPFFSLYTCIEQSIKHYGVKESDQIYQKLQNACIENWLELASKTQLLEIFSLVKKVRPIWEILAVYQFLTSINPLDYKAFYPNRPSQIAEGFRRFIRLY